MIAHQTVPSLSQYPQPTGDGGSMMPMGISLERESASPDPSVLRLMPLDNSDQPGSDSPSVDERVCNVWGTRKLLFMHPQDMSARGLAEGDKAYITTVAHDDHQRELAGLLVVPYDMPRGSVCGYFPECNPLLPVPQHAHTNQRVAAKNIAVRVKSALT